MLYTLPSINDTKTSYRYLEIYETIKQDIISGVLQENNRLPSIRKLAEFLSVSTTPVELAYQQLIDEGFIESRPRRGFYVVKLPETYGNLNMKHTYNERQHPSSVQAPTQETSFHPITFDFHPSKNDFDQFPILVWKRLHNQLFQPEHSDLLFYGDPQGELGLRQELAMYLRQFRGVICEPSQIVIAAEQHVLVQFLGQILKNHSDSIAVEDPGYRIIPATFRSLGYQVQPIGLDDQGLDTDLLWRSPTRIASVSPSHQFPMGIVMPVARRLELLEWARTRDGFLIEDDYGGEFRYQGRPIPALQGLAPNDRVIYLGGFSQVLAPDFCIHYMVLPERLVPIYHQLRREIMFEASSSRIHQRTLQLFMQKGYFEQHVRRMRNVYRKKNNQLVTSLHNHFNNSVAILGHHAGMHLVIQIQTTHAEAELLRIAREVGIQIASAAFYWNTKTETDQKNFIIGFGGINIDLIDEGISLLREVWSPYLKQE